MAFLIAILAAWQFLPSIAPLAAQFRVFNRFFIGSPLGVVDRIGALLAGSPLYPMALPLLGVTIRDAVIGIVIGVAFGALVGLLLSASPLGANVFRPFIATLSAVPRIAFIPIVVVIAGPTSQSSIIVSALVVFFATFFNAFEGGRSVKPELLDNVYLLGARPFESMMRVRLPFVLAWTVVALPAAAGFGLVGTVVTQVLTGVPGIGQLLITSMQAADATTTIALAILLGALGLGLTGIATLLRRTLLFWWVEGAAS
ncbi:ABC transporter permease [Microbacterium rhizomatis]|uniref:ABC transporter permease n=1 Tax=Microbacterium rhizomatis TaxID=1631477 RepID=UPI001478B3C7|nr:ABC transporter permease subunit [Microbacterium rhizomatis]